MNTLDIQTALKNAGFDPGPLDGALGPKTRSAVRGFQTAHPPLAIDGVAGPATLKALFPMAPASAFAAHEPPWFAEGKRKMGLVETTNYSTLMAWLRSDGKALGDIRKLPWCGDYVQTCIALTLPDEPQPINPYYATNWARFGVPLSTPSVGAVMVFTRPGGGHVCFYAGETRSTWTVLGGNQSNSVSVMNIAKGGALRLIATRWPKTYPLPTTGRVAGVAGPTSTKVT